MYLVMLLIVPVLIGIGGLVWSKGRITIKEFLVQEGVLFAVIGIGYLISRYVATADTEIWSGRVVKKERVWVPCSHSYPCNPYPCGDSKHPSTCWHTCYHHLNDWDWEVYTSNGEVITISRVDWRGSEEPPRWTAAHVGEPTAQAHGFTNYIKANPTTVLRRTGTAESFKDLLPSYPNDVYNYYYCDRFVTAGITISDSRIWNKLLQEVNADLGKKKQVNMIMVVVKTADQSFEYALEEAWIGGKKNDFVLIIGAPDYPKISWAAIMSWSQSEDLKVELRDAALKIGSMDRRDDIVNTMKSMVDQKFVRRPMADFEYLIASLQPGPTVTIILFVLGMAISVCLTIFFYKNDPFDSGRNRW